MDQSVENLKIKLFADGADLNGMIEMSSKPYIKGLTTNPTLMKKAGITNYPKFAKEVLKEIQSKPISFEVFSDDMKEMMTQGEEISSWGENVYVKVPVTNSLGESTNSVIEYLVSKKVKLNITALMTSQQVANVAEVLSPDVKSYVSVFAGRIADTGRDPMPVIKKSLEILSRNPASELIWASPRELLNIFHANSIGCHIITATSDILKKLDLIGYDLEKYSLDTVRMFSSDAKDSNFQI